MLALILVTLVTAIAIYFLKLNYSYWKNRGIIGPNPLPIIGNLGKSVIFTESSGSIYKKIYDKYQNEEMVGIYRATTPVLLVRDPDLIKEMVVKSFGSFHDNDINVDKSVDPLFGRNPFVLKGEEWKTVRAQLTPAFTSGKMKWIYPLLENVSTNLVKFIDNHKEATNGEGYEAKELSVRFTLNNVASCAFGLEGKCLEEEQSEFKKISQEFFSQDGWTIFNFTLLTFFPSLSKYISFRITTKSVEDKLLKIVSDTLKYREENGIVRNDFLHIMNELKTTSKEYKFTDVDVTAQAAGFFGDGSETSSIVMSFVLYEIAANPQAQKKLREEIDAAFSNNKITYDSLQSLPYLDAVINESLRLHPPVQFLQKVCTETFRYKTKSGKEVVIEKETPIILSNFGLQRDPKYYPEPEKFKPERFLDENKDNLNRYTFLPFGEGPRSCLGKRFGVLQIKIGIAYIVRNFELSVNKKTQEPLKYTSLFLTTPEGGLWLDFKKL